MKLYIKYIKKIISNNFNFTKIKLIFSVPYNFNSIDKNIIKKYFIDFGFNVIKIINESTSAAFYYSVNNIIEKENKIAIFDIGGGTLDITILEKYESYYEVIQTFGDNIGGYDFTKVIYDDLKKIWYDQLKEKELKKLWIKCKYAKEKLLFHDNIILEFENFKYNINNSKLENISTELINRINNLLDKIEDYDIKNIILVGGTSKLKLIQKLIKKKILKPIMCKDLQTIVAKGCCYYLINSLNIKKDNNNIILTEKILSSIGIETSDGNFSKIINKNSILPIKRTYKYIINKKEDDYLEIKLFQGNNNIASNNKLIHKIKFEGIKDISKILLITIEIDLNNTIKINIKDKNTKNEKNILLNHNNFEDSNNLNKNDFDISKKNELTYKINNKISKIIIDINKNKDIKNKQENINYLKKIKNSLNNKEIIELLKIQKNLNNIFVKNYNSKKIYNFKNNENIEIIKEKEELDYLINLLIEITDYNTQTFNLIKKSIEIYNNNNKNNIIDIIKYIKKYLEIFKIKI